MPYSNGPLPTGSGVSGLALTLTPASRAEYEHMLTIATPAEFELARWLQRLAFLGERVYPPGFTPAPVYMRQAMALTKLSNKEFNQAIQVFRLAFESRLSLSSIPEDTQ